MENEDDIKDAIDAENEDITNSEELQMPVPLNEGFLQKIFGNQSETAMDTIKELAKTFLENQKTQIENQKIQLETESKTKLVEMEADTKMKLAQIELDKQQLDHSKAKAQLDFEDKKDNRKSLFRDDVASKIYSGIIVICGFTFLAIMGVHQVLDGASIGIFATLLTTVVGVAVGTP